MSVNPAQHCCSHCGHRCASDTRSTVLLGSSRKRRRNWRIPHAADSKPPETRLEGIVRRKQADLKAVLDDLGMDGLDDRLQSAIDNPARQQYQLGQLIAEKVPARVRKQLERCHAQHVRTLDA